MRNKKINILSIICVLFFASSIYAQNGITAGNNFNFIRSQTLFDYNNISTWVLNSGIFNQDTRTNNTPGFMWPKGENTFAFFTSGLSIGTYIDGALRLATASYNGEYQPGYIELPAGLIKLRAYSDSTFKIYKITAGDNCINNPDWANWGSMVPYGAPYIDANLNYQYDACIDTPGVAGAGQTLFVCLTDGFPENHSQSEGLSGGTRPINAEVRLTAWAFNNECTSLMNDAQFFRWQIINKNDTKWDSTIFSLVCDVDLGDAQDDYIGCDTIRHMGYSYNSDIIDGTGSPPTYGYNPPAVGMRILRSVRNKRSNNAEDFGMNSFCFFSGTGSGGITCEQDPQQPLEAYDFMKGLKKDGSSYLVPTTLQPTKFVYPGNPETFTGWSERGTDGIDSLAKVNNCESYAGDVSVSPPGDRRFIISTGRPNLTINKLDTMEIIMTQLIAKGNDNFDAVRELKAYSDLVRNLFTVFYNDDDPVISHHPINNNPLPTGFYLSDNYPNPFNPTTRINYGLPIDFKLEITVYDAVGNEVAKLFDGVQKTGNYTLEFDGKDLASGIYFLKMKSGAFIVTRKMMLLK
ncbi:MAG: T9SS type A sorting domain-containing protein [Ignavibacteriae bacterium]|nr:T9SS type A sorting domain-containing protein [Ignavibacteriota bacterium]